MGQAKSPDWVRVAEHCAWAPRDSCGEVVCQDRMWLFGGWFTSEEVGPRDVWSSADGANWSLVTPAAAWEHGDLPTTLVYDGRIGCAPSDGGASDAPGKMWFMGGWYGGRKPFASASNQVWFSTDGAHWDPATRSASWRPRLGAGGAVFGGMMWILGGVERYFDGAEQHLLNDVWSSTDGAHWTLETAHAPWAGRAFHGVLAFDNKLWVFGGGNYLPEYRGYNDVWSSPDGVHWTRVVEHAPWSPRIWFSALVATSNPRLRSAKT